MDSTLKKYVATNLPVSTPPVEYFIFQFAHTFTAIIQYKQYLMHQIRLYSTMQKYNLLLNK